LSTASSASEPGWFARNFGRAATAVAHATGQPVTFALCCAVVLLWAVSGPLFQYSDTWQLVINTGTTVVTFLMVFLIQNTQNRDGAAIQAKLDELIRALEPAHNKFVGIEKLTEAEVEALRNGCEKEAKALDAKAAQKREEAKTLAAARAARRKA